MSEKVYFVSLVLAFFLFAVHGQEGQYIVGNTAEWREDPTEEYVKHLTHLNLCFIRPKGLKGELMTGFSEERINRIVEMGHRHGVKMGIAFGGGGVYIDSTLMKDTTIRATMISNLMDFVDTYNFDGVDNDWEPTWDEDEQEKFKKNQDMKAYYGIFTKQLRDSLDARFGKGEKELSASIMNKNMIWYADPDLMAKSDHFPKGFWEHLDFVSLMNYDNELGAGHGSFSSVFGIDGSVAHWIDQGIPIEKMCVGLPFYGRGGWGPEEWNAMTYKQIVDSFPNLSKDEDVVTCDVGGGKRDYGFNGITTIKKKQHYVDSLGMRGLMICFINFDLPVADTMSLLGAIIDYEESVIQPVAEVQSKSVTIERQQIVSKSPIEGVSIFLPSGRLLWYKTMGKEVVSQHIPKLASGLYIIEVQNRDGLYREIYSSR